MARRGFRRGFRRTAFTAIVVPLLGRVLEEAGHQLRLQGGRNARYAPYLERAGRMLRTF